MVRQSKQLAVWAWSLGCPKNRVDTERFLGSLGVPVRLVSHPANARIAFINTCAFIESATRESLNAIFETAQRIKKLRRPPMLVVAGCLPGRYGASTLGAQIPEVDLWLDAKCQSDWPALLLNALKLNTAPLQGRYFADKSYSWLKIAEGCQHRCAYCTIPAIRGPLRSEPADKLLAEAEYLVNSGVKELVLVAQDVAAWGRDFVRDSGNKAQTLAGLLPKLAAIADLRWLRLLYLYPSSVDDALLSELAGIGAPFLPYFDLPFQHSEHGILKRMRRPAAEKPLSILDKVYRYFPNAALRATIMVGFPGETDHDFKNLCDFVKNARFHNLGVFAFEAEAGTAAADFQDQIPEEVKQNRKDELMSLQAKISADILKQYVGSKMDVLVDNNASNVWPGLYEGRVWFQAPEIDGITYVSGAGVEEGAFLTCDIADSQVYDLSALSDRLP